MALAIAWQYFNAVAEARDDFAKTFLVIAPNVIVFERLRTDFEGGRIFHPDPIIPDDLRIYWDFQCYMRGEGERGRLAGRPVPDQHPAALRPAPSRHDDEPDVMTAMLGPKPPADDAGGRGLRPAHRRPRRPGGRAQRRGPPHARRGERVEQVHPPACTRRSPAAWPPSSTSPPRRGTPRASSSPGPSSTTRSSKPSSTASSSGRSRASPRASPSSHRTSPAPATRRTWRPASSAGRSTATSSPRWAASRSCSS